MRQNGKIPNIITSPPGPKSKDWHSRAIKYMKGYSSQVTNFPVVFERGEGNVLYDVDGNSYIDFSAGYTVQAQVTATQK